MKRKFLSLALALGMALGLLPSAAASMARVGQPELMAVDGAHAVAIQNGDLYAWGSNFNGGFADKAEDGYKGAKPIKITSDVVSIAGLTSVIRSDGSLWGWGINAYGQLGEGSADRNERVKTPVKVLDRVAAVSRSGAHTAAIRDDGTLWTWGWNGSGELGIGNTADCLIPVKVMDDVAAVNCGGSTTAAIKTDGSLWMWGANGSGQLGIGNTTNQTRPVKVMDNVAQVEFGGGTTLILKTDGSLWACGCGYLGNGVRTYDRSSAVTRPIKIMDSIAAVAAGNFVSIALDKEGTLYAWGDGYLGNAAGQSHAETPTPIMRDVVCAYHGTSAGAAIKTDGSLWLWGWAFRRIAGDDSTNPDIGIAPTKKPEITFPRGVRLDLNGGVGVTLLWANADGTVTPPSNPTKAGSTFAGWYADPGLTRPWNFNDKVPEGLKLYAAWREVSSTAATTAKSSQTIYLNGNVITLDAYKLAGANGGDVTYVKLRDVAALLDGSRAKFNVDWRNKSIYIVDGSAYTTKNGTELKLITGTDGSYKWNTAPVLVDGVSAALEGIVITDGAGGGHTFFKLRDLGQTLGFNVGWSADKGVFIETDKAYDPSN